MRIIPFRITVLLALTALMVLGFGGFAQTVYASQITIIVPNTTPPPENSEPSTPTRQELFPVSVIETYDERGRSIIIRRYELTRAERPEFIPREDFTFGSKTYTLTDITRNTNQNVEIRTHTETIEKNSPSNNLEQVLALLDNEILFDDGQFVGTLTLDVGSIKTEVAGRQTSSRTDTITREYPHLSSRDVSLVPKTVSHNNVNYTLTDVSWAAGNTTAVDYTQIGEYFTANATYSASISSTRITGYTVTANYIGEVGFTNSDIMIYEATFLELRQPAQIITPTPKPNTVTNDLLDMFINANQNNQNSQANPNATINEEAPTATNTPAITENQEPQNNAPIIREISRAELLEILSDGSSEHENMSDTQGSQNNFGWLLGLVIAVGVIVLLVIFLIKIK